MNILKRIAVAAAKVLGVAPRADAALTAARTAAPVPARDERASTESETLAEPPASPRATPRPSSRPTHVLPQRLHATARLNRPKSATALRSGNHTRTSSRPEKSVPAKVARAKVQLSRNAAQSVRMQAAMMRSRRRHEAEVALRKLMALLPVATLPSGNVIEIRRAA